MSFAFSPAPGAWVEIRAAGTLLPNGGEFGEPVRVNHLFVSSLSGAVREARGFVEIAEGPQPDGATEWAIEDVDGVPTRVWTPPEE